MSNQEATTAVADGCAKAEGVWIAHSSSRAAVGDYGAINVAISILPPGHLGIA